MIPRQITTTVRAFWTFHIPNVLVFIAMIWIILVSSRDFFSNNDYTQTLVIYISGIGISLAISSAIFTYAQCQIEKKN